MIAEVLERLYYTMNPVFRLNSSDVCFQMPLYVIEMLCRESQTTYGMMVDEETTNTYRGIRILPGYENKILFYHKRCVESGIPEMKLEIKIP